MSPNVVEMYGWAGLDFVIIGTEVEAIDKSMIESLLRAAHSARIVPMVKLAHPDPRLVAETLNYGANLLLVPHVTTGKQLAELVDAARFFPIGTRGECPVGRYTKYGLMPMDESRDHGNRVTSIVPIIEDKEAFDNIEEICANEHISLIEIGPFDFARSLGVEVRGPVVWNAVERITEVARAAGKKVMMPVWMTKELTSWPAVIQHQIEHLVGRGITLLFQPDVHVLADHYRNLMPLRNIRVREEPEAAVDEIIAPAANGKAPGKARGKAKADVKVNGKADVKVNGKAGARANGKADAKASAKPRATAAKQAAPKARAGRTQRA